MPRRRPPRDGHVNNFILLAAILFLPWLVDAQQQHRPAVQRNESPHEGHNKIEVTTRPRTVETPATYGRRKNTLTPVQASINNDNINKKKTTNDASAIATLAPAESAVAAPPTRHPDHSTVGLGSPHIARSLEDWEVEDFVLLATVDGKLHARERKTGREKWQLSVELPMVKTEYHRKGRSTVDPDYDPLAIDEYLWIVEPSRDGNLFMYVPNGPGRGLKATGLTLKKLVETAPFSDDPNGIVYIAEKKTSMVTVDANTGDVLSYFGSEGVMGNDRCKVPGGRVDSHSEECPKVATLTLGRTEYKLTILGSEPQRLIATLTFSEWGPNNYDQDLQRQHSKSLDNKYIYTGHDGGIFGFDYDGKDPDEPGRMYNHKFSTPVARVFDIAKPWGSDKRDPSLIMLPQPLPPSNEDIDSINKRASSVFLNHTEDGSWFAMSGRSYPLAVRGIRAAQCSQQSWLDHHSQWDVMDHPSLSEALVGLHSIEGVLNNNVLTLPGYADDNSSELIFQEDNTPALHEPTFSQHIHQLPRQALNWLRELFTNPLLFLFIAVFLSIYQREIRTSIGIFSNRLFEPKAERHVVKVPSTKVEPLPKIEEDKVMEIPSLDGSAGVPSVEIKESISQDEQGEKLPSVTKLDISADPTAPVSPEKEKTKKAHRGRRGGVKHRKGRASSQGASEDGLSTPKPLPTVEDAVRNAQKLGQQPQLEPDIRTIPSDPQEVSGPVIRIGALEVNTDKLIGTGSNGTLVFEGNFDGREVAVKRMLIQFFDIASQETKLLRESDDHPNVIRYYAQQSAGEFLYIALELCPASLADVIDKPFKNRDLAQAGERDLPNVLYQITNGLQHLHKLRIVHRDLKPQNILVAMGKDGKPRLLVSDFGLCKKLEGEQSSFRATTAHAAGTSGWRAPELLLDDDAKDGRAHQAMVDASTEGYSGSILNPDLLPNRRATRAIDIFSLGLVFFYVLTKGSHPFDCGDKFMREVNIRKGQHSLEPLEVLGDYAYEAKDLIGSMLKADPKQRPQARQVMAHPFFWSPKKRLNFLCDVSDHFEKEPRDPPSFALAELEKQASYVCRQDFLKHLGKDFVESMGKQRKYTGTRLLDLLRALRNKKNHYEDMSDKLKKDVGPLPDGYLSFWTRKFPNLLIVCWELVYQVEWDETDRFREYYLPAGL
ncbi:related to IRE1-protein kinase [Rhynchosporium agropyri]|uniref:non-specific serine/threonine protein kinase n=1 Tax=Rhynchosporium agropyri TaxID=914238 RepID=A0A1E1K8I2_9HELO|nr:related to IRE1-protein kinase [Rhynchosporium agropyri]